MRAVVQRVSRAEVRVEGEIIGSCRAGVMVLLGVHTEDTEADADWLARKVAEMRIFSDEDGKMNRAMMRANSPTSSVRMAMLVNSLK